MDELKQCAQCRKAKPPTEFAVDRRYSDGRRADCLSCEKAIAGGWRIRRPPTAQGRLERAKRYNDGLRTKVFDHYGRSCACCGSTRIPEIDHIDGNGRAHRTELFGTHLSGGPRFYQWLIKNGFPEGFQTLCARCNRHKGATDTCPLDHGAETRRGIPATQRDRREREAS